MKSANAEYLRYYNGHEDLSGFPSIVRVTRAFETEPSRAVLMR